MNLILSDRQLSLPPLNPDHTRFIDLSGLTIANCVGCFGCWTRTPGRCVIRDDAVRVYPLIARSSRLLYVTRVRYGCYDLPMKTMLERAIPVQQAFIRLLDGETHHVQRRVLPKQAVIPAYGAASPEEEAVFRDLVARNARNMSFSQWRVRFVPEHQLEQAAAEEVTAWNAF